MRIARYWTRDEAEAEGLRGKCRARARGWSDESLDAARKKALEIARRVAERIASGESGKRYPYGDRPLPEPILREFEASPFGGKFTGATELGTSGPSPHFDRAQSFADTVSPGHAIVTRNAYGSLVLNTDRLMFVDIDRQSGSSHKSGLLSSLFGKSKAAENDAVIEAMKQVTETQNLAARLYETAAGHRLIITSRSFKPASAEAEALLGEYGCDPLYMRLCRMQESFRARLTPKPWRCDFHPPGVEFPFETADAQRKFEDWERKYNSKAAAFGTCRFISALGWGIVDPGFTTLIDYHDHETKAHTTHVLA